MKSYLKSLFQNKELNGQVSWNVTAFFFIGITGLLINLIIAKYHGLEGLGIFNQIYAYYMVLSQVTSLGIQLSVLGHVGRYDHSRQTQLQILTSAILSVTGTAILTVLIAAGFLFLFLQTFPSSKVLQGFAYVLPGLVFFSINKVFSAFYNGLNAMRLFAVMQGLRAVLLIGFIWSMRFSEAQFLSIAFTWSEGILLIVFLVLVVFSHRKHLLRKPDLSWNGTLLRHGIKGFGGNVISEINSRTDVILLGWFVDNRSVGLYSFAAMFIEGFLLLVTVFINHLNPMISRYYYGTPQDFASKIRNGIYKGYIGLVPFGIMGILLFPLLIIGLRLEPAYWTSWTLFSILAIGQLIAVGYLPYRMLLNQTGFPGHYSIFLVLVFLTNVAFNLALIPFLGIYGAALATAISVSSQAFFLKILTRRTLAIAI